MRAGRLRNQATIQQNSPSQDTIGGEVKSWSAFASGWWCELAQVKGGEIYRGKQVHAQANYVATGRYVPGVTAKMRLALGSRTFDIVAPPHDVENRGRELRLDLLERQA